MNKLLLILATFLIIPYSFADSWDDFSQVGSMWDGQKSITNKEFEDAYNYLEQKKTEKEKVKEQKKMKKVVGGGKSLHPELSSDKDIVENPVLKANKDGILINIPVNIIIDDVRLEKGFYKIMSEKDNNNDIYLSFYQSQFFKGKVRASETNDDFGEEEIDFAKLLPYNERFVKIIFGSLDLNAYAYIRYINEL